jgi:hypothetical protein
VRAAVRLSEIAAGRAISPTSMALDDCAIASINFFHVLSGNAFLGISNE